MACLCMAVVSVLSYLGKANWRRSVPYVSTKLLDGGFLVPIAFTMLGVAFLKDIHRKIYKSRLIGTILFVLAVLAIFFISRDSDFDARLLQGGWLGVALGYPLLNFLGFPLP